jgi:hypothetical protein
MKEVEKGLLDSQLWHACAGGMVQIPPVSSKVFYFPQGHAEHALTSVDFGVLARVPSLILCKVSNVRLLADQETDEVYARIRLTPIPNTDQDHAEDHFLGNNRQESPEKPTSFAKTLTQSDANNGGGFSVPRYCAETVFPRLDYAADPPVQTVIAKDVHGKIWKFRHIYRGTPRRHLLTTGWSSFVNQKKLVAGDSIVFARAQNGDLCIGIRRAKRGAVGSYGGLSVFFQEESNIMRKGKVSPESVIEATALAASWQPFEIVYYPRASTPEFFVRASVLTSAMRIRWCSGMRFKMAFETEDSSRISWFTGTIASVQVSDPVCWPHSPWRLLQVTWDEPELIQNVNRVNPWLVELSSNLPLVNISPFYPARKKFRSPQYSDLPFDEKFPVSSFSNNPLGPRSPFVSLHDNIPAGIQGARHAHFMSPYPTSVGSTLPDHHPKILQPGLFRSSFQHDPLSEITDDVILDGSNNDDDVSCLLTIGNSSDRSRKNNVKGPCFLLFGQPILTEQQISDEGLEISKNRLSSDQESVVKVFLNSEDSGRNLDLSALKSYEELYICIANMFGVERSEMVSRVLYVNSNGAVKQTGDEPFSEFVRTAKRLTIWIDSSNNKMRRSWATGSRNVENGLDSANPTGALSIFA